MSGRAGKGRPEKTVIYRHAFGKQSEKTFRTKGNTLKETVGRYVLAKTEKRLIGRETDRTAADRFQTAGIRFSWLGNVGSEKSVASPVSE
jgi:hypothetical protein